MIRSLKMISFVKKIDKEFNIFSRIFCIAATVALVIVACVFFSSVSQTRSYNVDFSAIHEETDEDGTLRLELHGISLRKNEVNISVGYVSDSPAKIDITLENDIFISENLPVSGPTGGIRDYDLTVKVGTDRGKIRITHPAGTTFNLAYITISSNKPLYYDGIIWGIVLLLLIPCVWLGVYFFHKSTHKVSLIVAVGLVLLQVFPFIMQQGLHLGIDTRAHMMRIEGIYYGLLDGQFPVVIYPEWNNSYGQLGVLYPNLFLYLPAAFRLMGMSQLGACKLFIFLVISISAAIALASARSIFKREWQITLAIVIICLDNMRLLNMLGDGRIGGALLAEMFYPLVVAGLIEVYYHNRKKWYLLAYGMAGVFCCHIMTASIVCIAVALFALCTAGRLKDKEIVMSLSRAVLLFGGLIMGTFILFLKYYFTDWGQGNLMWEDFVSTLWPRGSAYDDRKWLFIITILVMCFISLGIVVARKCFERVKRSYIIPFLVCATVLFLMSTHAFPWVALRQIRVFEYYTDMIQDSYRFLSLADCFLAFCLPKLLEEVVMSVKGRHSYESKTTLTICAVTGILCFASYLFVNYEYFYQKNDMMYYDAVIGDIEYQIEDYLPSGTQREWYVSDTGYISDEDAISSLAYERAGTYVYYSYTNSKEGAFVEFPRFYYDGYVAEDEMAEDLEVYKGDHNRTRVYLEVTDTPAVVRMWYHVPWYLTLAVSLSTGLWIGSVMIVFARIYHRMD